MYPLTYERCNHILFNLPILIYCGWWIVSAMRAASRLPSCHSGPSRPPYLTEDTKPSDLYHQFTFHKTQTLISQPINAVFASNKASTDLESNLAQSPIIPNSTRL